MSSLLTNIVRHDRAADPAVDQPEPCHHAKPHLHRPSGCHRFGQRRLLVDRHHDALRQRRALSRAGRARSRSAATIDTQYTALTTVLGSDGKSGLNKLQSLLVEAKTAGIDRSKIQSEITQIQQDMKSTAASATFNSVNWLSTNAATPATVNLVSSFSRVGGTPTINSIAVTVADYTLYTNTQGGILDTVSGTASIDTIDIGALTDFDRRPDHARWLYRAGNGRDQHGQPVRRRPRRHQEPHRATIPIS